MHTIQNYKVLNAQVIIFLNQLKNIYNFEREKSQYELFSKYDADSISRTNMILKNIDFIKKFQIKIESINDEKLSENQKKVLDNSFEKILYQANILMNIIDSFLNIKNNVKESLKTTTLVNRFKRAIYKYIEILYISLKENFQELFD